MSDNTVRRHYARDFPCPCRQDALTNSALPSFAYGNQLMGWINCKVGRRRPIPTQAGLVQCLLEKNRRVDLLNPQPTVLTFPLERRSRWAEPGLKGETERRGGSSPYSSSRLGIWGVSSPELGPRGVSSPCLLVHFGTASLNRVGRSGDARRQHLRLRPVELTCLVLLGCGTKGGTSPCAGPET